MTTELAERRKGRALMLMLVAGGLAAVAAVALTIEARSSRPDLAAGLVAPGLSETIGDAQRISVTSAEATYRIERTQRGWAMRDRGDFPVLGARLAQLTEGLEQLRYVRRMTGDASRHERLGVGDPREGGRGVLVQVEDGRGAFLVNLILGIEPGGALYVRRPDDDQVWAARGELPPLRDVAAWLDLAPVRIEAARIARVEISPADGPAYILARASADAPFALVSPAREAFSNSMLQDVGAHITALEPLDVQPAPAIQGVASARVRAVTFDGVAIDSELIPSGERLWLKLVARAETPEQEAAALEINNQTAAWAYALSEGDVELLAPPLSRFLPDVGTPG
ncbi:MAG: DUF4340 domain-containing protein [Hyphomonadaceae bacterium]